MTNSSDTIWVRDEIDSPCIKICSIHREEHICVGCLRTMDEIGGWSQMSPEQRQAVVDDLPSRAQRLRKRRGGRRRA